MMKTLIYVVSTGSVQIFNLLMELLKPDSLRMPFTGQPQYLKPQEREIPRSFEFSLSYSLLHYAWASGWIPIFQYLISREELNLFSDDNPSNESPLHWAVCNKQEVMVGLIINEYKKHEMDLNIKDINGHTPLFVAAIKVRVFL